MSHPTTIDLASLRFDGARFAGHALDVDCTRELIAYRDLVLECAKELWRRKNPDRTRLPKGFDDGFRLQFSELTDGSAVVPLQRAWTADRGTVDWVDLEEFDEAADLIDAAIVAANEDKLLPEALPSNVVLLFSAFGKSLRDDEVLFTRARHAGQEAAYTAKARKTLGNWVAATYEDTVEVVGEVQMASVKGQFTLQLKDSGQVVTGKFTPAQEEQVLEALRLHKTLQLKVRGTGEFGQADRLLRKFTKVDKVDHWQSAEPVFVEGAPDLWGELDAIAATVPTEAWDTLPKDYSARADEYIYGSRSAAL
jgi:hypothetical protein